MNLEHLQYFIMVSDELNITKTAKKLYISQQTLSSHIGNLEKTLGVRLFERNPALSLTYAGERVYITAKKILDLNRQMLDEINDINGERMGKLRIGISHTRGSVFLPEVLPKFHDQNPLVEIIIDEGNSKKLVKDLLEGEIDMIIGSFPLIDNKIETIQIQKERLFLLVPKKITESVLRDQGNGCELQPNEPVNISIFEDCPFIMMTTGNRVRTIFDEYLQRKGIKLKIILETENIETLVALAYKGMGITVYPEMFVQNLNPVLKGDNASVDCFLLEDQFAINPLVIGYNKLKYLAQPAKNFIALCRDAYHFK